MHIKVFNRTDILIKLLLLDFVCLVNDRTPLFTSNFVVFVAVLELYAMFPIPDSKQLCTCPYCWKTHVSAFRIQCVDEGGGGGEGEGGAGA